MEHDTGVRDLTAEELDAVNGGLFWLFVLIRALTQERPPIAQPEVQVPDISQVL
jgi:hypothetical protein